MGPDGAVSIVFRREIEAAEDKVEARERLTRQYREELANPFNAASRGYLDDVILPEDSRSRIAAALESLREKRASVPSRKHGNIPL
jgi:acetyl-CoA carboxylase carboxyltransferase component